MKFLPAEIVSLMGPRPGQGNRALLRNFLLILAGMVTLYSALFHVIMGLEGQEHSWLTGLYWTLTVMSTLGFGDITFDSDLGRAFSMFVLMSGTVFLLVLLPFILIQFFWAPFMEAQNAARAPREIPEDTRGHVIFTHFDDVTAAAIERLDRHHEDYVLLVPDPQEAAQHHDMGRKVAVGELDDPETYERVRAPQAGLVATTSNDFTNCNVAFTLRAVAPNVPIMATANDPASVDILELAGCNHVLELSVELGQALARRTTGADAMTHTIGELGPLHIAEATAARTPLVGKTLAEARLRETTGINVVGVWERGRFESALPDTKITPQTVMVLAGTREQLYAYDELFVIYNVSGAPVVILGGGRVGLATGRALAEREIDYRIIEKDPAAMGDPAHYVMGSAAELAILEKAGIMDAPTVIITTNDDDLNVYLTLYCRRLRPDVQIITRATVERNVATLHRAGADFLMSYANMGANAILNLLKRGESLMLAEGLDLLKLPMPPALAGKSVADSAVREKTGVSIAAVVQDDEMIVNMEPSTILPRGRRDRADRQWRGRGQVPGDLRAGVGVRSRRWHVLVACALALEAQAGPPLLSDDPHTVGAGNVEAILSASGVGDRESSDVAAPVVDLTLGVFEGVDLALLGGPIFTVGGDVPTETTGTLEVGIKWQPLRGERWNASFTPTAALNALVLGDSNLILPVQIEYAWSKAWLGLDGGYVVDADDPDGWFVAVPAGLAATAELALVGEVFFGQATRNGPSTGGFSLGLDWNPRPPFHLLIGAGPGFTLSGDDPARWYGYVGVQWDSSLWSPD